MGIVTVTGEHDLLWGAQDGRPRRRLRQGPLLPPLLPTRSPLRPGTPQKVMLSQATAQQMEQAAAAAEHRRRSAGPSM
jgi:hypothetical protein